ncbi:MAG: hypothetical protein GX221_02485 [Candidatus Riflebacteria bacterium]|nr:hypothetical protein [Candidatus Riflebacteria bacterium]
MRQIIENKGVTFIEIMLVVMLLAMITVPFYNILRSGTDTSLKGMARVDVTLKARNIMKQVYADLKVSAYQINFNSLYNITDTMYVSAAANPPDEYVFYTYPSHEALDKILLKDDDNSEKLHETNYTSVAQIVYSLKKSSDPNEPFYTLSRTETFQGEKTEKVLSEQVNYFEIKPVSLNLPGTERYVQGFFVTLQLVDVVKHNPNAKLTMEKLTKNQKDIVLADFFDLVCPDYLNTNFAVKAPSLNWHSLTKEN